MKKPNPFRHHEIHPENDNNTNTWLTPPFLVKMLGDFDLDPCAAPNMPWSLARHQYTEKEDGLSQPWKGRVFCNPPYGRKIHVWISRFFQHRSGILLVYSRTDTKWFDTIWRNAHGIFFLPGRISFLNERGEVNLKGKPAASILASASAADTKVLRNCGLAGVLVTSREILTGKTVAKDIYEGCKRI